MTDKYILLFTKYQLIYGIYTAIIGKQQLMTGDFKFVFFLNGKFSLGKRRFSLMLKALTQIAKLYFKIKAINRNLRR
jgi:hypothetical protein